MHKTESDYKFREAQRSDIPQMKFIRDNVEENSLVSMTIDPPDYEKALFQYGKGWVCTLNDKVVGFSCGRLNQSDVWALFLDKKHEGRGIGHKLMELLESWMFSNGMTEIFLSTWPKTRAEYLYRRRGWEELEILKNGELGFRLKKAATSNFVAARQFASLMDHNKYHDAGQFMAGDCEYIYQDKVITGLDAILKTYIDNYAIAQKQLDEIQFTSAVVPLEGDTKFKLRYLDRIRKGDSWFEHRCEQTIRFDNSKIVEIAHLDLPGEAEKLKAWRIAVGIIK